MILYISKKTGIILQKTVKKTVSQFKKPVLHFKMIDDAHLLLLIEKKGENSKRMAGLRNVSRYRIKHKISVI